MGVLYSVMGAPGGKTWVRAVYVLIALGYIWVDVHYEAKEQRRRFERKAHHRRYLQKMRELSTEL